MPIKPLWLEEPGLQQLFAAVAAQGGEARVVGGCVRDHLLGRRGGDIDVCSSLLPQAIMDIAGQQGWKAIPTGVAYGTVTLVLPERTVEVTTLRRDLSSDGRYAEVAFTDRFEEDAARRDFTMNALYMDAHGHISDFFGGAADIEARRVRFIGDAQQRIREDGLRILRFFRFLATHGHPPADESAMSACSTQRGMLEKLSGERIQQEMKKLLMAPDPSYALAQMSVLAISELLCGCAWQVGQLPDMLKHEARQKIPASPWTRLLVMVPEDKHIAVAQQISARWKLSRADMQMLEFLTAPPVLDTPGAVKEGVRHYRREWVQQSLMLQSLERPEIPLPQLLPLARSWEAPPMPISAHDLLARGMKEGPELGVALRGIEQRWIDSDYRLTREQLLW